MKLFESVRWHLAGAFFTAFLVILSLTGLYLLRWTEVYYNKSLTNELHRESRAVAVYVQTDTQDLNDVVVRMGRELGHRITIIRSDGVVLTDSESDYRTMANHSDRPEIRQALESGYGTSTRYSATLKTRMLYVATSYNAGNKLGGVVRAAEQLSGLNEMMAAVKRTFILAGLAAMLSAALLSLRLASRITKPIENIAFSARKIESGDLSSRVPTQKGTIDELNALILTFNRMAEQLQSNIEVMDKQKARMQAVFDHTNNGLVLVDQQDRVRMINPVACNIFGVDCPSTIEKTIIEGTLSHDLASLVEHVRQTQEPAVLSIEIPARQNRALHAYVTPVPNSDKDEDVLIVLNDVTVMRDTETIRRDFVANVSHELRTPLASIKAIAETIMLRHTSDPVAVPGFAASIAQEVDRMTLLVEDLLDLTRIESQHREITTKSAKLRTIVDGVYDRLTNAAKKKSISLVCDIKPNDIIHSDPESLDQILVNLVDNAIKYTPDSGTIAVRAEYGPSHTIVRVSDNGMGIPKKDLPRIFERFYRVDKARSRESGGTGLGLAIVKHLCEQIGGSVTVESEMGKGSTFSVVIPNAKVS